MATYIPEDKISEISNAADIVDIVSQSVSLKKTGKNYVGLCPFHSEKTPSFTVSPDKQIFYCFGCGVGGNIFNFLMKQDGISFPEAARTVAKRYGIQLPARQMTPEQRQRISERDQLFNINRWALSYYQNSLLKSRPGKQALAYLQHRGINQQTIKTFGLGYVADNWDSILRFLISKNFPQSLIEKAGLVIPRKNKGGYYDRFRNRIIFPIFDLANQPIGFGGRVLGDALPKYLNSPETPLYHKTKSLYGLNFAKQKSRETESMYLVEGYFDAIALHQHGIENVVATLGTSLSAEHVRAVRNVVGKTGKIILVYDSDPAGIKAAERSIRIFDQEYVEALIMILPPTHDPDSFIFQEGRDAFESYTQRAKGIMPYLMDAAIKKYSNNGDLTVEGRVKVISELKQPLAAVQDSFKRTLYIQELAERLDIKEQALLQEIRSLLQRDSIRVKITSPRHAKPVLNNRQIKEDRMERQIIAMMLQFPPILPEVKERSLIQQFNSRDLKQIGEQLLHHQHQSASDVIERMDDAQLKNLAASLLINDESWTMEGCRRLIAQFEASQNRQQKSLLQRIKAAEANQDIKLLESLLKEKQRQAKKDRFNPI
ncbi:MAG: DNA primase [Desulfobacterales bacterium]|nr:DNA primase [Desulfobacterales bacterium]